MFKIIIAGGTGFLGKALEKYFTAKGNEVFILTRNPKTDNHLKWNAKSKGTWANHLNKADVLINLTGKSVDCRYTEANKKAILNSRISSTQVLNDVVSTLEHPPKIWINAGSATIYNHSYTHLNKESNGIFGNDFSMNVCKKWEAAFFEQPIPCVRKIVARTSIVMGTEGGAFPKMKQITQFGLGGKQGNGKQQVSWIHIEDFCRAIHYLIQKCDLEGVVNVTAPQPEKNENFMRLLRKKCKMPFGIPQPKWLLEIGAFFLRTETELLLKSRYVYPEKLISHGFEFLYTRFEKALDSL